jgi:hypothetical protein
MSLINRDMLAKEFLGPAGSGSSQHFLISFFADRGNQASGGFEKGNPRRGR